MCLSWARGGEDPSFISGYRATLRAVAVKSVAVAQVWPHRQSYTEQRAASQAVKAAGSGSAAGSPCL